MSFLNIESNEGVLFVTFNQDCSSLAVGTKHGCKLFSLQSFDKLEQIYEYANDDVCIIERLFSSSLVVLVSLSAPRKLKVYHFKKGTEICNYSYSNTILAVRLNRARLVVCLEESLYIHNIKDMKVLHTIRDTPPNPAGLCDLSINVDNCYLAYPGSNTFGEIQIFDTVNLRAVTMIAAHDNPVAAMSFNSTGTKIATASEKGTVIRIFSATEGIKLFEFRRGMKRCVSVCSLHFSPDSLFLVVSSNTETIHVFKLEVVKDKPEMVQGLMGYVNKAVATTTNYLPSQVSEMLQQSRDFATAYLPVSGLRNICAVVSLPKSAPKLVVASYNGYLYVYNFDPVLGGDCSLLKQFKFIDNNVNNHNSSSSSNNNGGQTSVDSSTPPDFNYSNEGNHDTGHHHRAQSRPKNHHPAATSSPPPGDAFAFPPPQHYLPSTSPITVEGGTCSPLPTSYANVVSKSPPFNQLFGSLDRANEPIGLAEARAGLASLGLPPTEETGGREDF